MEKHKKKIQQAASVVVLLLSIFIVLKGLTGVLERKSEYKLTGFLEEENDIDVLFFGTSHVRDGIIPMDLWRDYGMVSYNLAVNGTTLSMMYCRLVNTLDYQTPKLVVIDIYNHSPGNPISAVDIHLAMDEFPFTKTKFNSLRKVVENKKELVGALWTFPDYHTRWAELIKEDFDKSSTENLEYTAAGKGFWPLHHWAKQTYIEDTTPEEELIYDTVAEEYLCEMIELCQSKGIEVLLINTGYGASKATQLFANSVPELAKKYTVNYIDFTELDVVDFQTDLRDWGFNTHVNSSGARKLTAYLGTYIENYYKVPNHRDDEKYQSWEEAFDDYLQYKIQDIARNRIEGVYDSDPLADELTMLSDRDFSLCIHLKSDTTLLETDYMVPLIKNVSQYRSLELLDDAVELGTDYFAIIDNGWEKIWESTGEPLIDIGTTFGSVSYETAPDGSRQLFIQNKEENRLAFEGEEPDMQIFVINRYTGEVISQTKWKWEQSVQNAQGVCLNK